MYLNLSKLVSHSLNLTEIVEFSSEKFDISGKLNIIIHLSTYKQQESFEAVNTTESDFNLKPIQNIELSLIHQLPSSSSFKQEIKIKNNTVHNWYKNELLNPLDPDCLHLVQNLYDLSENEENDSKTSKINENFFILNEELLTFCSDDEISNNLRFKILTSRYKNDMKYKDIHFIPLFENEIEEVNDDEKVIEDNSGWIDPIDLKRHRGKKYLQKLYNAILNHCNLLSKNENASNLLIDDEPLTLG